MWSLVLVLAVVLTSGSALIAQGTAGLGPSQHESLEECDSVVEFEGFVFRGDGSPAEGAVVETSAGGKALVDVRGYYHLEAWVPRDAEYVQVTAMERGGGNRRASTSVRLSTSSCLVGVDPLAIVGAECALDWLPTFGEQPGTDNDVLALCVFDDGSGASLYLGGSFDGALGTTANRIARWDGSSCSALGNGLSNPVKALAWYDDGSGPALYAGGESVGGGRRGIARWDGSSWVALDEVNGSVNALAVYDDGSGPALYAAGRFSRAGGLTVNNIVRWDGSSWSALGSGLNSTVLSLAVYDDGSGPALYAGGYFTSAGGVSASRIARWGGSTWSALGSGVGGSSAPFVGALAVYDDGNGSGSMPAASSPRQVPRE